MTLESNTSSRPVLCVMAEKPSAFSTPILVDSLIQTTFGVHFVSLEEGMLVTRESGADAIIISPVAPARLYLTPNRPERPGFSVSKVRIEKSGQDYIVNFDRERGWEPWTPNVKLY